MGTAHAAALDTLKAIGRHTTARCLECHVVGYGLPNGFVSEAATPHLAGVQCENCHGPGGNHALDPENINFRPKVEMSSKMCGGCHSGQHHPFYNEWEHSHHSIALGTIANSSFARDTCLECHSQDYRYAVDEGLTPPTKATAQLSIECSTCHHPHRATAGVPAQLRRPVAQLCGECHTVEESLLGSSPHHPQFEMLSGIGMFREDGSALTNSTSAHALLASTGGESCATCHVVQHELDDPTAAFPHVTGHTFNPFDESIEEHQPAQYAGCADCHTPSGFFSAEFLRPLMQAEITQRLAALAPYFTASSPSYINPASLSATDSNRLNVAKFNYQFVGADSSKGIHNPFNAREGLDIAESIVESLANPPAVVAQGGSE
jgi:predicted CXXCH cytochrome family protein